MKDYSAHIKNPLTIIFIFVAIIEVVCLLALPNVTDDLKAWILVFMFVIAVPNLIAFYVVLMRSPQNFYGPQDFKSDASYLSVLQRKGNPIQDKVTEVQLTPQLEVPTNVIQRDEVVDKSTDTKSKHWFDYLAEQNYEKATELLQAEITEATSEERRLRLRGMLGEIKMRINFQAGVQYFNELIEQYPESDIPYDWFALSYLQRDLLEKGLAVIELGLTKAQKQSELLITKSQFIQKMGNRQAAIDLLEQAITETPSYVNYYISLLGILKGDNTKSEMWFKQGLTVVPRNESLLSSYANFLYENGRKEEALYHYRVLTNTYPDNPTYIGLLGNVYLDLELNDLALEAYEKARNLVKEPEAWSFANIGNLYKNRGLYTKAISSLNEALANSPSDEYAHQRLSVALKLQADEHKRADEIEKKGQRAYLQREAENPGAIQDT